MMSVAFLGILIHGEVENEGVCLHRCWCRIACNERVMTV